MELEEGECDSSECSSEEEGSGEEGAEATEDRDSKEESDAVLTALQQQLKRDLSQPCDDGGRRARDRETLVREEEEEEEYRVPTEKLQELGDAGAVHGMLANPHLRQLLMELDASPAPQQALRRAMNIPVFTEFADECLRICGLRDTDD